MKKIFAILFCVFQYGSHAQLSNWETMNPIPLIGAGVHHPLTFSIGDYGYSATGSMFYNDSSRYTKFVYRYNAKSDEWTEMNEFPGPGRSYGVSLNYKDKGYIGFGVGGSGGSELYRDLWEYNATTDTWKRLADCPCEERIHPAFVAVDGRIYVGLGNNSANLKDWWEYDIAKNKWIQKPEFPGPRRHHPFYFAIDSIAYVGFGHGDEQVDGDVIFKDFYKYNPKTEQWTLLSKFPGDQRVAGTQFDAFGKGYLLSGDGPRHQPMTTGEFWEYEPKTDKWTKLKSHPGNQSLWAPGSFVIGDYAYLVGGEDEISITNSVYRVKIHQSINTKIDETNSLDIQLANTIVDDEIILIGDIPQIHSCNYAILNELGQEIIQNQLLLEKNIAVDNLSAGRYFLRISNGKSTSNLKFVKM